MINIYYALIIFLSSTIVLLIMKKMSKKLGLLDVSRQHKKHYGEVPLVGGISIFSGILVGRILIMEEPHNLDFFFVAASVIFLTGLLDDRFVLAVMPRFILQVLAVSIMVFDPGSILISFGNIFGGSSVDLKMLSLPVTIIAVVGVINALNMVDGIDGLAASLSLVTLGSIAILSFEALRSQPIVVMLFISIIPYLLFNLALFGKLNKIFLGDSGSMLIGFILAWLLITLSQGDESKRLFAPVTALWMFAIPLIDTVSIMIRRVAKGQSPFFPDRAHLHHIIMRVGYSDRYALFFITLLSVILAAFGIWMEVNNISELTSFVFFLVFSFVYLLGLLYVFKLTKFVRNFTSNVK